MTAAEARELLVKEARSARSAGASFDTFVERSNQEAVALLSEKELNALFHLVWMSKRSFF